MNNKKYDGFKALKIKFSNESATYHELFVKEHNSSKFEEDKPQGRTLLVCNVPPYAKEENLERVFSVAGPVQSVIFEQASDHDFKVAYIVFSKFTSVLRAMQLKELSALSTEEHPVPTGLKKWTTEYINSLVDKKQLQSEIDLFMIEYDGVEEKRKLKEKTEDADGWTVVTKKSRKPGIPRKEGVNNRISEKLNAKGKHKQLKNFYSFQIKKSKIDNIVKLREKFNEDKKRIIAMKTARKFKPFG